MGLNKRAAEYAGVSVKKNILLAMFMSGALAGLAGASFYLGYYQSIQHTRRRICSWVESLGMVPQKSWQAQHPGTVFIRRLFPETLWDTRS